MVKPVGVSTQFSRVSGIVHSAIVPNVIKPDANRESGYRSTNAYYDKDGGKLAKAIKNPMDYDLIFVLAIPLGAYIGYILFDKRRKIKVVEMKKSTAEKKEIMDH
ncbi:MAG: hypothetical protein PUC65_13715 [Clostridiales bacterium]|nr:hypothetical protein [Clostridiales bacterium]